METGEANNLFQPLMQDILNFYTAAKPPSSQMNSKSNVEDATDNSKVYSLIVI